MFGNLNKNKLFFKKKIIFILILFAAIFFQNFVFCQAIKKQDSAQNLSFDFRDIEVRDLLQIFAEATGKNIVVGDEVRGKVSLHLKDVSSKKAEGMIFKAADLTSEIRDGVTFISKRHVKTLSEKDNYNANGPLSLFVKLQYTRASDLADLMTKTHGLISTSGSVVADARTNSLLIRDSANVLNIVKKYLRDVDVPLPQVLIEARIVYADENFARELGVKFNAFYKDDVKKYGMHMDLPLHVEGVGSASLAVAKLKSGFLLDLELSALETLGRGRVISSPKLVTLNRKSAYIEAGDEVPYQEKASHGATSVVFKKAVLGLKVTPEITAENKVSLNLQLNQDKVSRTNINGEPMIQTRQIQTQVLADNGQTIVLGGIYEESSSNNVARIPFLHHLPIVGMLFKNKQHQVTKKELLIFVTPRII